MAAWLRSLSARTDNQRIIAALTTLAAFLAREARRRDRRATRWSRLGGAASAFHVAFRFTIRGSGRPLELGRSGRPTIDDDVGFAWSGRRGQVGGERSELGGGRQRSANSAALTLARLASLASAALTINGLLAALTTLAAILAREARRRDQSDPLEPAVRQLLLFTLFVLRMADRGDRWSSGGRGDRRWTMMSASPGRGGAQAARAQRARRWSTTIGKFRSTDTGAWLRSLSARTDNQRIIDRVNHTCCIPRARGRRRDQSDPLEPAVRQLLLFHFVRFTNGGSGRPLELGRSGRPTMMMMSASPGGGGARSGRRRAQRARRWSTIDRQIPQH